MLADPGFGNTHKDPLPASLSANSFHLHQAISEDIGKPTDEDRDEVEGRKPLLDFVTNVPGDDESWNLKQGITDRGKTYQQVTRYTQPGKNPASKRPRRARQAAKAP